LLVFRELEYTLIGVKFLGDDLYWHFIINSYIWYNFCSKAGSIAVFAFTSVGKPFVIVGGDFSIDSYSVDGDEAMKQDNEALNPSSLLFFRSVKSFITTNFPPFALPLLLF
jgi:hypothetical protein